MTLPEICIKRPVFATVLSLIILLLGLISYTRLSVREYPRFGERQVSMRINLDRTRLAAYKLTVQDVEDAIRRQNAEIPAGRIESSTREFTVVAETDVRLPEQFNNVIVANVGSYPVRIKDVG